MEFGIAIPAYKDAARLRRCLDSVKKIDAGWLSNVTVVDDSGDGQVADALTKEFPTVKWIVHDRNQGFAAAANHAVLGCSVEWVLLLNDDSELIEDVRDSLRKLLQNEMLFAVSLQSVDVDGNRREGAKRLIWSFGIAKILHNAKDQLQLIDGVSETSYAVGGHALFSRKLFESLGGFDATFHPFYWEDVDLSQRARHEGYDVLYCENARVLHHTTGAIRSSANADKIREATWRNRLLFSRRYASGFQKFLQPIGLLWQKAVAVVTRDHVLENALAEFENTI